MKTLITGIVMMAVAVHAVEYHVSVNGNDANSGSKSKPFKTISRGAEVAMPGDTITVHEGVYREEINPPHGGTSEKQRIVYRAAEGEEVVIKGSEVAKGWIHVKGDVWKLVVEDPDAFFGSFNPFRTQIYGDWFLHRGRLTHTAQVYLNGNPLTEAAGLDEVMKPTAEKPLWYTNDNSLPKDHIKRTVNLLDITFNGSNADPVMAADFHEQKGVKTNTQKEQTYIHQAAAGGWAIYEDVDFGKDTTRITFNGLASTMGLHIEIRLNGPDGKLFGTCPVSFTGPFWEMNWKAFNTDIKPISGKHALCLVFVDIPEPKPNDKEVVIWAQFKGVDPNEELVEVHSRETVFYPRKTGINYITVSGFTLEHGSPNWAPPTAEQVALIGTHWSKGWIIENNTIRHSSCVGLTLGKYGDAYDNTSADSAEGYVETIRRAEAKGWTKETVGSHIVRNNTIHSCGAAGICGSLGAIFSEITGNHVYDINIGKPWSGHEMAGIKFHAPIDMLIKDNRINNTSRGIWLDWMTQGTRVTGNLLYNNGGEDIYIEVNHGPYVVDNNLFVSQNAWCSLKDWSQGGAFAHNIFLREISAKPSKRSTPYHKPHSTEIAGLSDIRGGDNRFYNNIVGGKGLVDYSSAEQPSFAHGNVYLKDAQPLTGEAGHCSASDAEITLAEEKDSVFLNIKLPEDLTEQRTQFVTTQLLGETAISKLPYKNYDEKPLRIDNDYFGNERMSGHPAAGPFFEIKPGQIRIKVWPKPVGEQE